MLKIKITRYRTLNYNDEFIQEVVKFSTEGEWKGRKDAGVYLDRQGHKDNCARTLDQLDSHNEDAPTFFDEDAAQAYVDRVTAHIQAFSNKTNVNS